MTPGLFKGHTGLVLECDIDGHPITILFVSVALRTLGSIWILCCSEDANTVNLHDAPLGLLES